MMKIPPAPSPLFYQPNLYGIFAGRNQLSNIGILAE